MNTFDFNVGSFDCTIVSDGFFSYPHPAHVFFPNAPRTQLEAALDDEGIDLDRWDTYDSPYPSLLINDGRQRILVDAGAGSFGPNTGKLLSNLSGLGVAADDIDILVLTHIHPDHVGGALDSDDRRAFPNARYVCSKTEWEFWSIDPDLSSLALPDEFKAMLLSCAERLVPNLESKIDFVAADEEIIPGIQVMDLAGHTPGQIGLRVDSNGHTLFAVADAIVHPVHVQHPEWNTAVDLLGEVAITTRKRLLDIMLKETVSKNENDTASKNSTLMFAYHFPFPGLGTVHAGRQSPIFKRLDSV